MEIYIRYAICNFDSTTGRMLDDDGSLEWKSGTIKDASKEVEKSHGKCALLFPADVPGKGNPLNRAVKRQDFERNPTKFGVCYCRTSDGKCFFC